MDHSYFTASNPQYPFHGLATPVQSYSPTGDPFTGLDATDSYQAINGFAAFGPSYQYHPHTFISQPPHQHDQSPPLSNGRHVPIASIPQPDILNNYPSNGDYESHDQNHDQSGNRSSSEEKESLTPAQSRRKAQNRAAQRAFRERKERHVKELETKISSLAAHSTTVTSENERLKRELQKLSTQNEILRQSSHPNITVLRPPSPISGPQTYSPTDHTDFQRAVGVDPKHHPVSFQEFGAEDGERLLHAGATWDLIQSHELYRKGMVDVGDLVRRLRGKAECDGRGPAFKESEVIAAIEESVISAADELI